MDPRVRTSTADLALQFKLSKALDDMMRQLARARADIAKQLEGSSGAAATRLQTHATALQQAAGPMISLFESIQRADAKPTAAQETAVADLLKKAEAAIAAYKDGAG
jgi:prephenate dehydratase